MHRIDTTTKSIDKFGAGKHGYTNGTPGTTPPTEASTRTKNPPAFPVVIAVGTTTSHQDPFL